MSTKTKVRKFTAAEIDWGLKYPEGEDPTSLNPVLLYILANMIRHFMERQKRPFDDVRHEILEDAFRIQFERGVDSRTVRKEMRDYSRALGKMFNNRQNFKNPDFAPTERVSEPRPSKDRILTMSDGQRVWKPGRDAS